VRAEAFGGDDYLVVGGVGTPKLEILKNSSGEEKILLGHDAQLTMKRLDRVAGDIPTIDQDSPFLWFVKPGEKAYDTGLTRTGVTDERDRLTGVNVKGEILQDPFPLRSGIVTETDIFEALGK
jgi:hypothetical protein